MVSFLFKPNDLILPFGWNNKDGFFKNYRLMEGLWYKYDDNGILVSIQKYKKGSYYYIWKQNC